MSMLFFATFEWPNNDLAFVSSLVEELQVFGRIEHQNCAQQHDTTTHKIKLRGSPAIAGRALDLFAGVAEAGAFVTLEMHTEEGD